MQSQLVGERCILGNTDHSGIIIYIIVSSAFKCVSVIVVHFELQLCSCSILPRELEFGMSISAEVQFTMVSDMLVMILFLIGLLPCPAWLICNK